MNNDYVTEKCYDRMIRSEMVNKREQMTYDTSRKERFTDCCPDQSGNVIPLMWSQEGGEPRSGEAVTTSDREVRAKRPLSAVF